MESVSESPVDLLGSDQGLSKKLMTFPIRLETITSFYLLQLIGGAIFFTFSNRLEEVYSINLPQSIGDYNFFTYSNRLETIPFYTYSNRLETQFPYWF